MNFEEEALDGQLYEMVAVSTKIAVWIQRLVDEQLKEKRWILSNWFKENALGRNVELFLVIKSQPSWKILEIYE